MRARIQISTFRFDAPAQSKPQLDQSPGLDFFGASHSTDPAIPFEGDSNAGKAAPGGLFFDDDSDMFVAQDVVDKAPATAGVFGLLDVNKNDSEFGHMSPFGSSQQQQQLFQFQQGSNGVGFDDDFLF